MQAYKVKASIITNLTKLRICTLKLEVLGEDVFKEEPATLYVGQIFSPVTIQTLSIELDSDFECWLMLPEDHQPLLWILGVAFGLDPSEVR